jgi:hypothetical protein
VKVTTCIEFSEFSDRVGFALSGSCTRIPGLVSAHCNIYKVHIPTIQNNEHIRRVLMTLKPANLMRWGSDGGGRSGF